MAQVRITNSYVNAQELVSLSQMKDHLRVSGSDEDDLILAYMNAASDYISSVANRTFRYSGGDANVYLYLDRFEHYSSVRRATNLTLNQVRYKNNEGGYSIMDPSDYVANIETYPATFTIKNAPQDLVEGDNEALYRIWFKGGEPVSGLPHQFRAAMMLLVAHYYTNREAEYVGGITTEIKEGVKRLLTTVKLF